jgi:hypothetical protein
MITDAVPTDLHELEYSRHILEEILGWPAKSNLEMMADCLRSIGKAKHLTPVQSYKYMVRAIMLAKEQGITVDRFFFMEGRYTEVRPEKPVNVPQYTPINWKAVEKEQSTPAWLAANAELRAAFAKLAGKKAMS